jgi:hypothetical protein
VKPSQGFEGKDAQESNLSSIQRFFADFIIDNHMIANIVFSMLPQISL